jgi:hypothetical protein
VQFFDLEKVSEAMKIISMEEFVEKVAMKGDLMTSLPLSLVNLEVQVS